MLDNGFVVQNEKFDYLLSMEDEIIFPKKGNLEVPLDYMNRYNLSVGDKVLIEDDYHALREYEGECVLGKYNPEKEAMDKRNNILLTWLSEKGF